MKNKLSFLFALLIVATSLQAQINFIKQPEWKDVLAKAKAENKPIFVDAYTDWCIWCKVMDKNTFPDPAITEYMNKNFVCVKMEMETGYGCILSMKYRVSVFPTFLVFSPEGKLIDRLLGYIKPADFVKSLDKVRAIPANNYPQGITSSVEMPFPDFYHNAFIKNADGKRTKPDSAIVLKYLREQKDLTTEVNWSVLSHFRYLTSEFDGWVVEHSAQLKQLYGKTEVEDVLNTVIYNKFKTVAKRKDEQALQTEIFPMIDKLLTENIKETKAGFKLEFYKAQGNYAKVLEALNETISIPGGDYSSTINATCWDIYEKCDDAKVIQSASRFMGQLVAAEPQYAYLDTYAAILYKAKDYQQAEVYANKAIEAGKKENQKVGETEELLKKIKAEQPKN